MTIIDDYFTYLIRQQVNTTHDSPNFVRLRCLRIQVARLARAEVAAEKAISDFLCIHHCKLTPVHCIVGNDNHTNASSQTRNYRFFAFLTLEFLGLLAFAIDTAHRRPQHWRFIILSKMIAPRVQVRSW